jgi:hypothetical protein
LSSEFAPTYPFIAIEIDAIDGGYFDPTHIVYCVNSTDHRVDDLYESLGGFFTTDASIYQTQPNVRGPFSLPASSSIELERSSQDEFEELSCSWILEYQIEGTRIRAEFRAGRGLQRTTKLERCPILNRAVLIPERAVL